MYYLDRKEKPYGWDCYYLDNYHDMYEIIHPGSKEIFMHYNVLFLKRAKIIKEKKAEVYLKQYINSCKFKLIEYFSGMKYSEYCMLGMKKRVGNILIGRNIPMNGVTKEFFIHMFQSPEYYNILNFDIELKRKKIGDNTIEYIVYNAIVDKYRPPKSKM